MCTSKCFPSKSHQGPNLFELVNDVIPTAKCPSNARNAFLHIDTFPSHTIFSANFGRMLQGHKVNILLLHD